MSTLPEWLWPLEDEEAVQEAERLIEETHNTLQKMEANMRVQRISGHHLSHQTEKLKVAVNNKIHFLEKELKTLSDPGRSVSHHHQRHSSDECKKPTPQLSVGCNQHPVLSVPSSHINTCSKVTAFSGTLPQNLSSSHSVLKQGRTVNSKKNTSDAEKVVETARAKVQDALTVARNLSASLSQHVPTSSQPSKLVSCRQINNIGNFEVKSQSDDKNEQLPKKRLGRTTLPSLSIKQGLGRQSIPSIQVAPGPKLVTANVSVINMEYNEDSEKRMDQKDNDLPNNLQFSSVAHQTMNAPLSTTNTEPEGVVAQLSKQLAEVEELREVNQAQVNHILRFLLSRVCNASPSSERSNTSSVNKKKECKLQSKQVSPNSSSTSQSSQHPIAYDSLSRFLETYKRAAEQSMLAQRRATERKRKVAFEQRKELQKVQSSTENHLLIGPLRHTSKLNEADLQKLVSEVQDSNESYSISSSLGKQANFLADESNTDSIMDPIGNFSADKEKLDSDSLPVSLQNSIEASLVLSQLKPAGTPSGEDYEDDWEEEKHNSSPKPDEEIVNSIDSHLKPIIEAEENISSVSQSEKREPLLQQHLPDSLIEKNDRFYEDLQNLAAAPHLEETRSAAQAEPFISPTRVEEPLPPVSITHNGEGDAVCLLQQEHGNDDGVRSADNFGVQSVDVDFEDDGRSTENTEDSGKKIHKSWHGKATFGTHPHKETKEKQHQTLRKRTQARFLNLHSSSSEAENNDFRPPPRNSKRWDLNLKEDLQLQSAILLNWHMEERLKSKNSESFASKNQTVSSVQHCDIAADIEKRWQRTLDQLDQRVKSIEENERIHRIANEIRLQARQEVLKNTNNENVNKVTASSKISDKENEIGMKAPTKDQMVQTSPEKGKLASSSTGFEQLPSQRKDQQSRQHTLQDYEVLLNGFCSLKSTPYSDDLTTDLLAYSRMPRLDLKEQMCSQSSSSSTTSSKLHHSSILVSLSDGELRGSMCGSCCCSEGEFCICGGRKQFSERAPPDGSQTLSDGENFIKDVSQGEITLKNFGVGLKDVSLGEIAEHISTEPDHLSAEEESIDSDYLEWEGR